MVDADCTYTYLGTNFVYISGDQWNLVMIYVINMVWHIVCITIDLAFEKLDEEHIGACWSWLY